MDDYEILTMAANLHESSVDHGLSVEQVVDLIWDLYAFGIGEEYLEGVVLAVCAGCILSRQERWERLHLVGL